MDCFVAALLAMWGEVLFSNFKEQIRLRILAACIARALLELLSLLKDRGRREDRVRAAPAVLCAMCTRRCAHEHTGPAGASRPSLRNGFTAYFALSPVTGFLATVISEKPFANLTPAPGRQDHTPSPSAAALFVQQCIRVHRIPRRVDDVG